MYATKFFNKMSFYEYLFRFLNIRLNRNVEFMGKIHVNFDKSVIYFYMNFFFK